MKHILTFFFIILFITNNMGQSCDPGETRKALMALYNAGDGEHWATKKNWGSGKPFREWEGVSTIEGSNCVVDIHIQGFKGHIPKEINILKHLYQIEFVNGKISSIAPDFWELPKLKKLSFSSIDFEKLISNNIGHLHNLKYLYFDSCDVPSGIPSGVGQLKKLKQLNILSSNFSGNIPKEIGNAESLELLIFLNDNLSGTIPKEIGKLSRLELLLISNTQVTGSIPEEIGLLNSLHGLILSQNQLSGEIPIEIGDLDSLEFLHINNNSISGRLPIEIGNLSELHHLDVSNNQLSGDIPKELGKLTNLEKLFLDYNNFEHCIPQEIIDAHCHLGFNSKADSSHYNGYNLTANPLLPYNGDMEKICNGALQTGATCDDGNPDTVNDVLDEDCVCRGVSCAVRDKEILTSFYVATHGDQWKNKTNWNTSMPLEKWFGINTNSKGCVDALDLHSNHLVGVLPKSIGGLAELTNLSLFRNEITGVIPKEIGNLANLKWLLLFNNDFDGVIPPQFGQLRKLQQLSLFNNNIDGVIPSSLGQLSELTHLELSGNKLTGNIPKSMGNFKKLISLNISKNKISGRIPTELGALQNLQWLNLHDNQLIGEIPLELSNLSNLRQFYLQNNHLSGCFPTEIINKYCNLGFNPAPSPTNGFDGYNFMGNPLLPYLGDFAKVCNGDAQNGAPCDDGISQTADDSIHDCQCGSFISKNLDLNDEIVQIIPNPFNIKFTIQSEHNKITKVVLFNMMGQKLKEISNTKGITNIYASHLSKGVYMAQIQLDDGVLLFRTIIKQ